MKLCAIILLVFISIVWSADELESDYPLIAGHYEVIGRRCESGMLFTGSMQITGPAHVPPDVTVDGFMTDGQFTAVPEVPETCSGL
jgi:hypothetical protein